MTNDEMDRIKKSAYDAALAETNRTRPLGRKLKTLFASDEEPSGASDPGGLSAEGLEKVMSYLRAKLSKDDLASVEAIIAEANGTENDYASDSAVGSAGFYARFPGARRIGRSGYGDPAPAKSVPPSEKAVSDFYSRYPGAAKIGSR